MGQGEGGDTALDYSGYKNHATLQASSAFVPEGVSVGASNSNDYVNIPHSALHNPSRLSVLIRFRILSGAADDDGLISKTNVDSHNQGWGMYYDSPTDEIRFFTDAKASNFAAVSFDAATDFDWHTIIGTYDGSTLTLYKDGVIGPTTGTDAGYVSTTEPLRIGRLPGSGTNWFTMPYVVSDVLLYNRVLLASETRFLSTVPHAPWIKMEPAAGVSSPSGGGKSWLNYYHHS